MGGKELDDLQAPGWRRFTGFASTYDRFRPRPPKIIGPILANLAGVRRPALVVDLGCGTGLSTRLWSGRARRVIGIDASEDMLRQARRATAARNVAYRAGLSYRTGLPDGCADIVTCSQSLHWMPPGPTFREIARILRPGGAFAAIDCDWPPTFGQWELEAAYSHFMATSGRLEERLGVDRDVRRWPKERHLERMRRSGRFRYCREILLHGVETGSAARLVGLAMSLGSIASLLKNGASETEIGLADLRRQANRLLGRRRKRWLFSYRIRVGIV